jgi:hypothetical protein
VPASPDWGEPQEGGEWKQEADAEARSRPPIDALLPAHVVLANAQGLQFGWAL